MGCLTDWQREVSPNTRFGIQNHGNIIEHTEYENGYFSCLALFVSIKLAAMNYSAVELLFAFDYTQFKSVSVPHPPVVEGRNLLFELFIDAHRLSKLLDRPGKFKLFSKV